MLTPDRALDVFLYNLPEDCDQMLLETGTLSWLFYDSLSPEERKALHKKFEAYASRVTELKVKP